MTADLLAAVAGASPLIATILYLLSLVIGPLAEHLRTSTKTQKWEGISGAADNISKTVAATLQQMDPALVGVTKAQAISNGSEMLAREFQHSIAWLNRRADTTVDAAKLGALLTHLVDEKAPQFAGANPDVNAFMAALAKQFAAGATTTVVQPIPVAVPPAGAAQAPPGPFDPATAPS